VKPPHSPFPAKKLVAEREGALGPHQAASRKIRKEDHPRNDRPGAQSSLCRWGELSDQRTLSRRSTTMAISSTSSIRSTSSASHYARGVALESKLQAAGLSADQTKKVLTALNGGAAKGQGGRNTSTSSDPGARMEAALESAGITGDTAKGVLASLNGGQAKSSDSSTTSDTTIQAILQKLLSAITGTSNTTDTSTSSTVASAVQSDGYTD
jgi:hypothetical protein